MNVQDDNCRLIITSAGEIHNLLPMNITVMLIISVS